MDFDDLLTFVIGLIVFIVVALCCVGIYFGAINAAVYIERSTQNGVTCIVKHSELTNTVLGTDCPKPFTNDSTR